MKTLYQLERNFCIRYLFLSLTFFLIQVTAGQELNSAIELQKATETYSGPVIDMHLHTGPGSYESTYYDIQEGELPEEARYRTLLKDMNDNRIVLGMLSGPPAFTIKDKQTLPDRFIAGIGFPCTNGVSPNLYPCFKSGEDFPDLQWLREKIESGQIEAFGELYHVYAGISPADPRMDPYYAMAAEYDIPVAVHADRGPPPHARKKGCCPNFNSEYGNPGLYHNLLKQYPNLRLFLMHIIDPEFVGVAIELMNKFPNVYLDTSPMSLVPQFLVHESIRRIIEAGHEDRIMFGSDDLGAIGQSIDVIEAANFLTPELKKDIFYNNAARFLGLTEEQIAEHHKK